MKEKRKIYLDNIRSITVIIVMIYHVFYLYNGVGVIGGFPVVRSLSLGDAFCTMVYPWFMILLFCISGIAARSSLKKRGAKPFLRERAIKLLVPSTLGCLVVYWIVGYIGMQMGGGIGLMPEFLIYPIAVLSGTGPLWFAQLVFLYSVMIVQIAKIDKGDRIFEKFENIGYITLLFVMPLLLWGSSQILNMPVITVYRFGIYFVSYIMGYYVLSSEKVLVKIEKLIPVTSALSVVFLVIYMILYYGENYTSDIVLKNIVTNFYAWFATLAIIGIGKKHLNRQSIVNKFINSNSYGFYVLHYMILLIIANAINSYTNLTLVAKVIVIIILEFIFTITLNEIVKRIPILRFIMLGMKGRKNEIQTNN